MKRLLLLGAILAVGGLAIAPAQAQTQSTTTSTTSTGYVQSSKIIGSKIRAADGSEVGIIKDVVLDRQTGCMAYTVLETTGDAGRTAGSSTTTTTRKTVAMPYTAFQTTGDPTVYTTTIQRERIYNAPAFEYSRIEEYSRPEYVSGVYSYYGVQPAVGINVGVSRTNVIRINPEPKAVRPRRSTRLPPRLALHRRHQLLPPLPPLRPHRGRRPLRVRAPP